MVCVPDKNQNGEVLSMKKLSVMLLVMALVFAALAPTAFAAVSEYDQVQDLVDKANAKIEKAVGAAIEEADRVTEKYLEDLDKLESKKEAGIFDSNKYEQEKARLAAKYEQKIDKIIDKLVEKTGKVAAKAINDAVKKGFVVICEEVEVEIAGRTVLIDPLRIADF